MGWVDREFRKETRGFEISGLMVRSISPYGTLTAYRKYFTPVLKCVGILIVSYCSFLRFLVILSQSYI